MIVSCWTSNLIASVAVACYYNSHQSLDIVVGAQMLFRMWALRCAKMAEPYMAEAQSCCARRDEDRKWLAIVLLCSWLFARSFLSSVLNLHTQNSETAVVYQCEKYNPMFGGGTKVWSRCRFSNGMARWWRLLVYMADFISATHTLARSRSNFVYIEPERIQAEKAKEPLVNGMPLYSKLAKKQETERASRTTKQNNF